MRILQVSSWTLGGLKHLVSRFIILDVEPANLHDAQGTDLHRQHQLDLLGAGQNGQVVDISDHRRRNQLGVPVRPREMLVSPHLRVYSPPLAGETSVL